MFYVIGLGLGDAKDVTVKGLEIIRKCDRVYLEAYTSILTVGQEILFTVRATSPPPWFTMLSPDGADVAEYLNYCHPRNVLSIVPTAVRDEARDEEFYGRPIIVADRELVESGADEILGKSDTENVAFLVVGDPFGATTHTDLVLRAKERGIKVQVVHNASILNAVGCCGLQLYSYGEIVSIPYWTDNWEPDSFYDKIAANRNRGLHTLCLLDIKVKEPTLESILKRKKEYMPPKFMSVSEAADQLIRILDKKLDSGIKDLAFTADSLAVGLARVGADDQKIVASSLRDMTETELGPPLHCLVIPARFLHPLEAEYLLQYATDKEQFEEMTKQKESL